MMPGSVLSTRYSKIEPPGSPGFTTSGVELDHALAPLAEWGKKHVARIEAMRDPQRKEPRKPEGTHVPRATSF